jgi:hypothetical protein
MVCLEGSAFRFGKEDVGWKQQTNAAGNNEMRQKVQVFGGLFPD